MFDIKVKEEVFEHCERQLESYNFGQRGIADGNREQQLVGIIGQSVITDLFDLGYVNGSSGFDYGEDLNFAGWIIDVKTMGRTTSVRSYYVNNFLGLQKKYSTDIYIFCSYNKRNQILTVCGWVTKDQFNKKAKLYKKDTIRTRSDGTTFRTFADLYEIANSDLNDVDSLEDLKKQIKNL